MWKGGCVWCVGATTGGVCLLTALPVPLPLTRTFLPPAHTQALACHVPAVGAGTGRQFQWWDGITGPLHRPAHFIHFNISISGDTPSFYHLQFCMPTIILLKPNSNLVNRRGAHELNMSRVLCCTVALQPPPRHPVRALRGAARQAGPAVQRENIQGTILGSIVNTVSIIQKAFFSVLLSNKIRSFCSPGIHPYLKKWPSLLFICRQ